MSNFKIVAVGDQATGKTITLQAVAELLKNLGYRVEEDRNGHTLDVTMPESAIGPVKDWTAMVKPSISRGTLR